MHIVFGPIARGLKPGNRIWVAAKRQLDDTLRLFEVRRLERRSPNLILIPPARMRTTGSTTLRAYAYDIGFISALVSEYLPVSEPQVLDLGCGPGKGVCVALPFLGGRGQYHGLDVNRRYVDFDRSWYPAEKCTFIHADLYNAYYNSTGVSMADYRIPLEPQSIDLVLALSLFTHLGRADAEHYFREMSRVMKPGAVGLLTFCIVDDDHTSDITAVPLDDQEGWFNLSNKKNAEARMGVERQSLGHLMGDSFELVKLIKGRWRGLPAAYHQDVVIVRRRATA